MFANIKHSIIVFNEHLIDVCEDSSRCEKPLCLAGRGPPADDSLTRVQLPETSNECAGKLKDKNELLHLN